ncbi:hypothetical protein ACSBR1_014537 [Camellia fascicularis]
MSLAENNLTSNLLSSVGLWLPNLNSLFLGGNKLTGIIPESISNASNLALLDLDGNAFTGSIPKSLVNLRLLEILNLENNNLTSGSFASSPELSFLASLINCKHLKDLIINQNPLDDILPTTIGNLLSSLKNIRAEYYGIRGNIPSEIGNVSNMAFLSLRHKGLTRFIPSTIKELRKLQILDLFDNRLQGSILDDICQLKDMDDLRLNQNELFGLIPECLGNITSLRYLYLNSNKLTFVIPTRLGNLKDILEINLSLNSLNGNLPPQLGSFKVTTLIDFSMNQFTGKIPTTIIGLQNLVNLSLAHNKLQGSIPDSFGNTHRNLTKVTSSCSNLDFKVVVLEYMPNRSLEKWLYSYNYFLDMLQRLAIMIDVACALKHLYHGYSIPLVHCDFKPNNILLDDDMVTHPEEEHLKAIVLQCVSSIVDLALSCSAE